MITLLLSLSFALPYTPQDLSTSQMLRLDLSQELDLVVNQNHGNGGGTFRVSKGSDWVVWEGASGHAVRNGALMTPDANFEIASTSKAVTAAAVMVLVDRGVLDLDWPISWLLPASLTQGLLVIQGHDYGPSLTLRQLLSNTSGLPDYWQDPPFVVPGFNAFLWDYSLQPQRYFEPEELLDYVRDLTPRFVPGTDWHYSDSGFVLAGLVLEQVSGQPLHEVLRDLVFDPLQMDQTWLHWRESAPAGVLQSHRYEGTWDMYTKRHNSADWAGGGLVSTNRDLHRFLRGLVEERLFLNPQTLDTMQQWVPTGGGQIQYGLGLYRVPLSFGLGWIWGHDGYGNSWMYYWPDEDVTFVGGLNQTNNDWWPLIMAAAWKLDS